MKNNTKTTAAIFLISLGTVATTASTGSLMDTESIYNSSHVVESTQSISPTATDKYKKIYQELESYKALKDNWDGYNGIRPTDEVIDATKNFLAILKNYNIMQPRIMVSGDGQIALFWKDNKKYIEVDFDIGQHFSYFYEIEKQIYGEDDVFIYDRLPTKLLEAFNMIKVNSISNSPKLINTTLGTKRTMSYLTEVV